MKLLKILLLFSQLSLAANEPGEILWYYAGCSPTPSECRYSLCYGKWIDLEIDPSKCDPEDLFEGGFACYCGIEKRDLGRNRK